MAVWAGFFAREPGRSYHRAVQHTRPQAEPKPTRSSIAAVRLLGVAVLTFTGVFVSGKLRSSHPPPPAPSSAPSVAPVGASVEPSRDEASIGGVEELRPRGPRVNLNSTIELDFSAAVDRRSVEASLETVPPIEWRLSWPKATRLRLEPKAPLKSGTVYRVSVGGQMASGVAMEAFSGQFRTEVPAPRHVVPGRGGNVILSFDDGPRGTLRTRRILELLERYHAKVLFFPTAQNLARYPKWIQDVEAKGHRVCNHSYTHPNLTSPRLSEAGVRLEIQKGAGFGRCRLFRPPMMAHDERTDRIAAELGYSVFLWDIDTRDWEGIPADEIYNRVMRAIEPGSVVLFHLQARRTLRALRGLLPRLVREGYVLSWDPRDVDRAARARFGVGRSATWLGSPEVARQRWLDAFDAPPRSQPPCTSERDCVASPWPFPVGETEPSLRKSP